MWRRRPKGEIFGHLGRLAEPVCICPTERPPHGAVGLKVIELCPVKALVAVGDQRCAHFDERLQATSNSLLVRRESGGFFLGNLSQRNA